MSKPPSPLGAVIESAFAARFARHRDPVQYLATFQTASNVFGVERVTQKSIVMWMPNSEAVQRRAEREGLSINRSAPWPNGRGGKYGRLASLRSITKLADAALLRVKVGSVGEALMIAEALES